MESEFEANDQSESNTKLMFFDEMQGEEDENTMRPSANIRVNVRSCKREGKDWIYFVMVGVAYIFF